MNNVIGYRYRLQDKLGEGGMGTVHRAYDRLTGDIVAIKRISNPLVPSDSAQSNTQRQRTALAQEFHVLATMRHPHIISVLDYGFDEEKTPYYSMELLHHAQDILSYTRNKPLTAKLDLLVQVLQAVAYLHRRGIIHRDLKPDNILVVHDQVKVLDFGLAVTQTNTQQRHSIGGTMSYMSPETIMGASPSVASDLYAFGVTAYQLLTNQLPFATDDVTALIQNILHKVPDVSVVDAPDDIRYAIERLLAKDPLERFLDAESVLTLFTEALDAPEAIENMLIRESYLQAARFVGRTKETETLINGLKQAQEGNGSLWLLGGESGVGKSRLTEEIRTWSLVNGVVVLRGQAIAEGGASYLLWRSVLRMLCLRVELTSQEASVIKTLVPDIGTLIEQNVADAPTLDPDAEQTRLFNTIEAVFRKHQSPTLIIMEDLHWAQESLALLGRFSKGLGKLPIMIVGTYRDDEAKDLPKELPNAQSLRLQRLNESEIEELSTSILGGDIGKRQSIIQLLRDQTEGNAFFIVEIVRTLAEQFGHLSQIGQMTLPPSVLAGGIGAIVQRRLKNVPEQAYALLELMAVAGRNIDQRLLHHLMPSVEVEDWLLACSSVLDVQENEWRFAHDKLREALISQLDKDVYTRHHQRVAEALEGLYPNDEAYHAKLAYHWREAKNDPKESHYSALVGKTALAAGNYQEAVRALNRAFVIGEDIHAPHQTQSGLMKQLGDAYLGLGKLGDSYNHFSNAIAYWGHMRPQNNRSLYTQIALEVVKQARHRLSSARTSTEETLYWRDAALACSQLSLINYFGNQKQYAFYYSLLGMNLAHKAGTEHRDTLASLQSVFTVFASVIPLQNTANAYARLTLKNLPPADNVVARSWVLMMLGIYYTNSAQWDIAISSLQECLGLAESAENVRRIQEAILSLAAAYFFKGDWKNSYQLAERLLQSGLTYDNIQCQAWGLDDLGRVLYHRGEHAQALENFEKSNALYQQIQDKTGLIWVNGALAQVHTRMGKLELARPYAERTREWIMNTSPGAYGLLEGYRGIADFYLTQYEKERTPQNLQDANTAVRLMHRFGRIFSTGKSYRYIYESWLESLLGNATKAIQLGKQAIQEAQKHQLRYEEGLAGYHVVRFLPQDHPQREAFATPALSILIEIGAEEANYLKQLMGQQNP